MTEAYIIDACRTPRGIGKVGKGSHTYLVSPMTAMASAVKGVLTDPRDILK